MNGPNFNISASVWAAAHGIRANVVVGSRWPVATPPATSPALDQRRRVFLRGLNRQNVLMVAPAATYGGQVLERLTDGRMKVGPLILTIHEDGALSFDRAE